MYIKAFGDCFIRLVTPMQAQREREEASRPKGPGPLGVEMVVLRAQSTQAPSSAS